MDTHTHTQCTQNAITLTLSQPASSYRPDAFLGPVVMTHQPSLGKTLHDADSSNINKIKNLQTSVP